MSINSELVHRVCVVGAGSWGTAVAKLVAFNCKRHPEFEELVTLWVHDEKIRTFPAFGEMKLLSDVINSTHVNPKYLPGVTLPDTVVAEPDLAKAASQATLVIIAVPHEYLHTAMFSKILSGCAPNCRVCSLVKGLDVINGRPSLVSERIKRDLLGLDVAVLMGANIASEVAASEFCEATLGTNVPEDGPIWQRVFNTDQFRVNVVLDATGVELCGALKPIISLGAGFCDGMDCGANTKASIVRIGLEEMLRFSKLFFPRTRTRTFFESCGVAELIVSSYGGRTRRCAEAFARAARAGRPRAWAALEKELLHGQKLPTMERLQEVMECIRALPPKQTARFPLFSAIYSVAFRGAPPARVLRLPERVAWRHKAQGLQLCGGGPCAWGLLLALAMATVAAILALVVRAEHKREWIG